MKLNEIAMKQKKDENGNGIIEIERKLKNAEWKIIGNKKRWINYCPKCNKEILYSQKGGLKRALIENRVCMMCRQDKIRSTCLKKYSSTSPLGCKDILEKTKITMRKKYGYSHPFQSISHQNACRKYRKEKFGVEFYSQHPNFITLVREKRMMGAWDEFIDKSNQTKEKRYGDKNYNNSKKIKETCLKKYGVYPCTKVKEISDKIFNTILRKYGKTLPELAAQSQKFKDTNIELKIKTILDDLKIEHERNFHIYDPSKNKHKFYDFHIKNTRILIEADGDYWHSLPYNIENDKYKDVLAKNNNFTLIRFKEKNILLGNFKNIFISKIQEYGVCL